MNTLLTWKDVKKQLSEANENKSLLVGNGFSLAWDSRKFTQKNIINNIPYLKNVGCDYLEEAKRKLKSRIQLHNKNENHYLDLILLNILNIKIDSDFIKAIFKSLPSSFDNKAKAASFYKFLKMFSSYFTLNYDPLLYILLNKFRVIEIPDYVVQDRGVLTILLKGWVDEYYANEKSFAIVDTKTEKSINILKSLDDSSINSNYEAVRAYVIENHYDEVKKILNGNNFKPWYRDYIKQLVENRRDKAAQGLHSISFTDGFSKDKNTNDLTWDPCNPCNYYHVHGALHIADNSNSIVKMSSNSKESFINKIDQFLNDGNKPIAVVEGTTKDKLETIYNNTYLQHCYEKLSTISGILVTHGVSFAENDQHIVDAIKNNKNLKKVYVGCYSEGRALNNLRDKFKDCENVKFFITKGMFKTSSH